jgi:hypothetical protein
MNAAILFVVLISYKGRILFKGSTKILYLSDGPNIAFSCSNVIIAPPRKKRRKPESTLLLIYF